MSASGGAGASVGLFYNLKSREFGPNGPSLGASLTGESA